MTRDLTDAALRAAWARIQPAYNALPYERAMAWPPLALVIRMAARGFNSARQSVAHPTTRALEHALRGRAPGPVQVRHRRRPDAKQRAANDVDLFTTEKA